VSRFPRFRRAAPVEARLGPGDLLVIPKYWWHCVYAVEPSVNLTTWCSWGDELSPWRMLAGAPLSHRSCTALAAEMKRRQLFGLARASRSLWYAIYSRLVTPLPPEPRGEQIDL
jgi:hypothetical protein